MAAISLPLQHEFSICSLPSSLHYSSKSFTTSLGFSHMTRRGLHIVAASPSFDNQNREFVIVGGGNAACYAARTFVKNGMADGRLCIVTKEAHAYLFPPEKNRRDYLQGFHTCVGAGGERQTPDWYQEKGIEDPVTDIDTEKETFTTTTGKLLKYGPLICATGCTASQFPKEIGGNLPGVHYIRDVADADSLVASLSKAKKVVVGGGGYIGTEVSAAAVEWNLDITIIFPEQHLMPRLFTPKLAQYYEDLYEKNGVKFMKGASIEHIEAGPDGHVSAVKLADGSSVEADTVVIGVGAKPTIGPFEKLALNKTVGEIQVDGLFRASVPGIFDVGDIAAFPLKIYDRVSRVKHVDHARKSAQHCVKALLTAHTGTYDYLPYFYSRVFEHAGSERKVWWQFYGLVRQLKLEISIRKIATFWIESGKLKGILVESGSAEDFQILPEVARRQPAVKRNLALAVAQASLDS